MACQQSVTDKKEKEILLYDNLIHLLLSACISFPASRAYGAYTFLILWICSCQRGHMEYQKLAWKGSDRYTARLPGSEEDKQTGMPARAAAGTQGRARTVDSGLSNEKVSREAFASPSMVHGVSPTPLPAPCIPPNHIRFTLVNGSETPWAR